MEIGVKECRFSPVINLSTLSLYRFLNDVEITSLQANLQD